MTSPSSYGYLNAFLLKKQQTEKSRPISVDSLPIVQRSFHKTIRPKSTTLGCQYSSTDDDRISNSRINIGITLDSRLRKTPVFDMLRSTMMESTKTYSSKPIARF